MDSERVQQVHGQRRSGTRGHAVGPGQRDAYRTVAVDGLHQDAHGQCKALRVSGIGVTQQGYLVVGHGQALVAQALLQEPDVTRRKKQSGNAKTF